MKLNKTKYKLSVVTIMTLMLIAAVPLNTIPSVSASTATITFDDVNYTCIRNLQEVYTATVTGISFTFDNSNPFKIRVQGTIEFDPTAWPIELPGYTLSLWVPFIGSTRNTATTPQYDYSRSGGSAPQYQGLNDNTQFTALWQTYTPYDPEIGYLQTQIHFNAIGCQLLTRWDFLKPADGNLNPQYRTLDYTITCSGVPISRMFGGMSTIDRQDEINLNFYSLMSHMEPYGAESTFDLIGSYLESSFIDRLVSAGTQTNAEVFWTIPIGDAVDNEELHWYRGGDISPQLSVFEAYHDNDAIELGSNNLFSMSNNQKSYIQTTVTGPGELHFHWKVSSEENYDYLKFYIDGTSGTNDRISGTVDEWQEKTYNLAPGSHTLKWEYAKDGSVAQGLDCGWVDYVQWIPEPQPYIPGVYGPWIEVSGVYQKVAATYLNTPYLFASFTSDPQGDNIKYVFDWGDGTTTTTGWYPGGYTAAEWHTWITPGQKTIKVKAYDPQGHWSESQPFTVNIIEPYPPLPPPPFPPMPEVHQITVNVCDNYGNPLAGDIYIDGDYAGQTTATQLVIDSLWWGQHQISVDDIAGYAFQNFTFNGNTDFSQSMYLTVYEPVTVTAYFGPPPVCHWVTVDGYCDNYQASPNSYNVLYIDGLYGRTLGQPYSLEEGTHTFKLDDYIDCGYWCYEFLYFTCDGNTYYSNTITLPITSDKTIVAHYNFYFLW